MIYFDEYGNRENPTILMLHGAAALDTFCQQYCLSEKYHLVVPHLPGAGKAANEVYEPKKTKQELYELIEKLHKNKIGVIGHSLGGQIAVMLVSERPELFSFAVFLSAWVNPKASDIKMYCKLAKVSATILHWKWLVHTQGKYWNYTTEQANYMVEYSKQITPQVYRSFFTDTLNLSELSTYPSVCVPMYAICGSKEVKDMKVSLNLLAENPHCKTMILQNAGHDFPMRNAKELNQILKDIISTYF
ncbi:MAG: alpha/beta fold hydrolase [Acutalibacteraceae bacterium]